MLPGISKQHLLHLHCCMMIAVVTEDSRLNISCAYVEGVGNAAQLIHLCLD